jgi:hypothetical protein
MKKNLFLIACVITISMSTFAQSGSSVRFDGSSYNFIFSWKKKPIESHWTGLGFAFSNLEGLKDADLRYGQSYSVILNLVDYTIPINYNWLFVSGLGFDWSRYHFKGNIGLQDKDGIAQFVKDEQDRSYKSNKLLIYYASIPLLLEYQTSTIGKKTFFIQGGVEALIKCYSKSKLDIRTERGIEKVEYNDLNILPLQARLVMRAGFDDISIFGYYHLHSIFANNKGPDVTPCGIGLMLDF